MTTIDLGPQTNFPASSVTRIAIVGRDGEEVSVAVIRIADTFYALGDTCSHADVSLSGGTLWADECELECPKHGSAFSIKTGKPSSFPATKAVPTYAIRCVDGNVLIDSEPVETKTL
jgi:3-phenylpropionate/trans-cinnamate dioxygenase ferredoxin component